MAVRGNSILWASMCFFGNASDEVEDGDRQEKGRRVIPQMLAHLTLFEQLVPV